MPFKKSLDDPDTGVVLSPPRRLQPKYLSYSTVRPEVAISRAYVRSLRLTNRDRQIIRFIGEMGYATTDQIARLWFGHVTRPRRGANKRLKDLWEMHLLDRNPDAALERYGLPVQLIYMLGRAGATLLSEEPTAPNHIRRPGFLMTHNVLLTEAAVRLTTACWDAGTYKLVVRGEQYQSFEWNGRAVKLRPDGLFCLRSEGREIPFFVELDTGTKGLDSFLTTRLQYELYYRSETWRDLHRRFPGVLIVCCRAGSDADSRHRRACRRAEQVLELIREHRDQVGVQWFFTTLDDVASGRWQALVERNHLREVQLFPALAHEAD
jgi:hypothetical protein